MVTSIYSLLLPHGCRATFAPISFLYRFNPVEGMDTISILPIPLGRILLSTTALFFVPTDFSLCPPLYRPLSLIKEILPRKSIGSPLALEIFFTGGSSFFFVFPSKSLREQV